LTAASNLRDALRATLHRGGTIALGDGVGALSAFDDGSRIGEVLSAAATEIGDIRLVLGWLPTRLDGIEAGAFADVVILMPGWGARTVLADKAARFVPTPLSGIPALIHGTLRPDVLLTRLTERGGALHFSTEVSWQRMLIDRGTPVLAILDDTAPAASSDAVPPACVRIVAAAARGPAEVPIKVPTPIHDAVADNVLRLIPPGARVQFGPGQVGTAVLRRTSVPLRVDTGLLTDAVIDLERRGLLIGQPSATYLLGSRQLYEWADGRPILRGIEYTHDPNRLGHGDPFISINSAIEIDPYGQINSEGLADNVVGGIGGHPDYCAAGRRNPAGLSVIAVPSRTGGRSPLVQRLSRPVSTPAYDVDIIVTETGHADLRGADWARRHELITQLFAD
jgi:hypothetical protein